MGPNTNQNVNRSRNGHVLVWEQPGIESEVPKKKSELSLITLYDKN